MAGSNFIYRAREQAIFTVPEVSVGTLTYPAADQSTTNQGVVGAGYAELNQNPNFTDSPEIINSRDIINRFQDITPAGTWSVPMLIRPSGSAGSVPQGSAMLKAIFGKETIVGGTSVSYEQTLIKPSFSLWMRKGESIFFSQGGTASGGSLDLTSSGAPTLNLNGGFMKMGWAGTTGGIDRPHSGATATDTTVTLATGEGQKFTVGAMFYNETLGEPASYDPTFAATADVYKVTDVTGDVLTFEPALDTGVTWSADDVLSGYLPDIVNVGSPLESKDTVFGLYEATLDGTTPSTPIVTGSDDIRFQSLNLNLNDPVQYVEDEVGQGGYPTDYLENTRDISGSVSLYFRRDDIRYFADGYAGIENGVIVSVGDVAGDRIKMIMPRCTMEIPTISTNEPAVNLSINFKALGGDGEDSLRFVFD